MEIVTNDLWRRDVFPPPRPVRSTLGEEIVCGRKKMDSAENHIF